MTKEGNESWYLVKVRKPESPEHAFLCWKIYEMAKERFKKVKMNITQPGDVVVKTAKGEVAFEIETGTNFSTYDEEEMTKKFAADKTRFTEFYIVVTDYNVKRRYEKFGRVLSRTEVKEVINGLAP